MNRESPNRITKLHGRARWPLFAGVLLFLGVLAVTLRAYLRAVDGHFVYAGDDTYVQMAIAKNLAEHGVWGITRHAFTGAGTSLLWPMLLALSERLLGPHHVTSFVLNVLFAIGLLILADAIVGRHVQIAWLRFGVLVLLVIGVPLPSLSLIGMEHVWQTLAAIALSYAGARVFTSPDDAMRRRWEPVLLASAAIAMAIRYDTGSVVVGVAVVGLMAGAYRAVARLLAAAAVPPIVYAIVAWRHGWPALPSSVLLRGRLQEMRPWDWSNALTGGLRTLLDTPALAVLVLASLFLLLISTRNDAAGARESRAVLSTFVVAVLVHVQFGQVGSLYRYEAYLVGLGIVAVAVAGGDALARDLTWRWRSIESAACLVLALLVLHPLVRRFLHSTRDAIALASATYRVDYQVGVFLNHYPPRGAVVVNSAGPPGYLSDVVVVDIDGLADLPVTRALRANTFGVQFIERYARERGATIAVIQDPRTAMPESWVCVGQWRDDRLEYGFYATDAVAAPALDADLKAFDRELPSGVRRVASTCR